MVTIRDIKTICTAPEGINLLVVKVETSEPGLYGLGCGTFAYRYLAVKLVVEEYLRPLLIGRDVSDINDIWQLMHQNGYSVYSQSIDCILRAARRITTARTAARRNKQLIAFYKPNKQPCG